MISSIAADSAALNPFSTVQSGSSGASAQATGESTQTPAEVGLGSLTSADWKLVSAAVGKDVGPDAAGHVSGAQPLLAWSIEMQRQNGSLSAGQELTLGDLKAMGANEPAAGYVEQINNAVAYLEDRMKSASGSAARTIDVTA